MTGTYNNSNSPREAYDISNNGVQLTEQVKVKFTVALASKLLHEYNIYNPDRPLNSSHVNLMLKAMLQGTFLWETVNIAVAHCLENDKTFRINGQHTCWSRLEAEDQGLLDTDPHVTMLKYSCKSMDDIRALYASFDLGKSRSHAQRIHAICFECEELEGISRFDLQLISSGLILWKFRGEGQSNLAIDASDIAYLMKTDYNEPCHKISHVMKSHQRKYILHLRRAGVMGAMLASFHYMPAKASPFWDMVATGVGPEIKSTSHPCKRLYNHLITSSISQGSTSKQTVVSSEQMFRWCAVCWRAWRQGRDLQYVRNSDSRPFKSWNISSKSKTKDD
jgi:hypothetical protein